MYQEAFWIHLSHVCTPQLPMAGHPPTIKEMIGLWMSTQCETKTQQADNYCPKRASCEDTSKFSFSKAPHNTILRIPKPHIAQHQSIHVHTHTCIYMHTYTYILLVHACIVHTYMHVDLGTHMYMYIHIHIRTYLYSIHTCMYMYIHIHVHLCTYMYMYIHTIHVQVWSYKVQLLYKSSFIYLLS